jgi:hypothetical protein
VIGYPSDDLFEEVAYVAYYFHWPYDEIMSLEHRERRRWVSEISRLNAEHEQTAVETGPWS